jgi:hypothetical protein
MGTARELFQCIKIQTQKIYLNYKDSEKYHLNNTFKLYIDSKIQNPYHQLTLCLNMHQVSPDKKYGWILDAFDVDWNLDKPTDWDERVNYRKFVHLKYGIEITSFPSPLYNERMTIDSFQSLTDTTNLQFVNNLTLNHCDRLSDLSPLRNARSLSVCNCRAVTTVNGLGNIHNLTIEGCHGLTDIRGLTNNYRLTILSCGNIQKQSGFGKVICLTTNLTSWLSEKRDLSEMKCLTLYHSDLSGSFKLSLFTNLSSLTLQFCDELTSLEGLEKVKRIEILAADSLIDISCLGKKTLQFVSLTSCKSIANFRPLDYIQVVHISNCMKFVNGSEVQNVPFLKISLCPIVDVSTLGKCQN